MPAILCKKPVVYALRALLGLLVLLSLLAWLLGTESALRWSAQQAERLSEGKLTLGAVHGSLYGPLRIDALRFQTAGQRFDVKEAEFDWAPLSLFKRHLRVKRLAVQELRISEIKPSAEPTPLPETLHLPLSLSAPDISVQHVSIKNSANEFVFDDIQLGVDNQGDRYRLNLRRIVTEWGKGSAGLALGDTRPFKLIANASLKQAEGWAYRAEAEASGNLSQVRFKAQAHGLGGQADIQATLAPFEENPLVSARVTAQGMNPALLRRGLPKADLGASMQIVRQGSKGFSGNIALSNGLPGRWDQSRWPLRGMTAGFSGALAQLDLRAIHLDLAEAGRFQGAGQLRDTHLQLGLKTADFNPRGLHGKMRPMRLAGGIRLQAGPKSQQLAADLRYQGFQMHLDARHRDALIELRKATVQSASGRLALHGSLTLEGQKAFRLDGALQGFNPADFGDYPAARVNASLNATGRLEPEPRATLEFAVADSHFRHQPLSGQGKISISATRIWNGEIVLRLAQSRLEAKGALGNPGDRLDFVLDVANLAKLDPELGGKAHASGVLEGRFAAPSGRIGIEASGLSWRKHYRLSSLQATGRLDRGIDGPLSLEASLRGLITPQLRLDLVRLGAQGTRGKHTLQLLAKNPDFDLESHFAGGWRDQSGWSGQVLDLSNHGRHALALKSPAKLEINQQGLLLSQARFDFAGADLVVHEFKYGAGQFASSGGFQGLPLAYLQAYVEPAAGLTTDLTLGGDWKLAVRDTINGHLALYRERGDISLPSTPRTALGLQRITLNVDALNNRLQGRLEAAGSTMGSLKAEAQGVLARRNGTWGITGDGPVSADADLSIPSLAWLAPLLDDSGALALDGALRAKIHAGGSFAQPRLAGTLSGDRLSIALPEQGLRFTDGSFQAELRDQTMLLQNLTLRGGDGSLNGRGRLTVNGGSPSMQLELKADKLAVSSRPDRHLVLSGSGDASITGKKIKVTAQLKADRGLIELPKEDVPTPSDDVVVLNGAKTVEKKPPPYALSFNLGLDLGEHFYVKGKGLDAQLGGTLKLTGVGGGLPSSHGSIRVVKGAYSAYGQRLEIERGILNFQGPVDNPGLDIIALRKNQPVEAGVALSGTAQSPRVSLTSKPSVPDGEKLSWLVLGHGLDDSSSQEFNALQTAAGALLATGQSVTLQQRVAHAAGLEEVSLKGAGGLEGSVLALGKRLSSRAYLSYEQGLGGAGTLVKINYTLSRRLSVRAQAGAAPAVDLFYTFSFD